MRRYGALYTVSKTVPSLDFFFSFLQLSISSNFFIFAFKITTFLYLMCQIKLAAGFQVTKTYTVLQ